MNFTGRLPQVERISLSTMPVGRGERRLATGVIGVSAAVFLSLVPFATVPLPVVPPFIPAYEAALVICDLITGLLLIGQFAQHRSRALLVLACGYLFDGLIVIPHALSYPGVFAPNGLLGAGPHTTAWLYVFWHGGFPIFVMAYVGLERRSIRQHVLGATDVVKAAALVACLVGGITLLTTAGQDFLPPLMAGSHYRPALTVAVSSVLALSSVALVGLWRKRSRSVLDIWLMAVMSAWLCDVGLSAVLNGGRYDLGFYAGRIYGLLSASFILAVILLETSGLYSRMAKDKAKLEEQAEQLERNNQVLNTTLFSLLDALSDSIITIDEQGVIQTVNPAFERLFGQTSGEVVGHNVKMLMPEPYHSQHDGYLSHYLAGGTPRIIGQGQREVLGLHKDGHSFPVDLSVSEVSVAGQHLFIGAIRDNTARKQAEDALRASEFRLRLITDSLPIAIFQISSNGHLLFGNKVFSQWFGKAVENTSGCVIDSLFKPSLTEQWNLARNRLRSGETVSVDGSITDLEATRRDIRLTMVPRVGVEGDFLGLMEDVTNHNATLAQLHRSQKMEAVGQLTGGIAHDFNNLLGIIIGNLDLLEGAFDNDPDNADLAKSALGAALRGADLTRALLAFSRRQALNPVQTDVGDILTKLAQLLRRTLGEQILVTLEADNGLWPVSIDVAQLESSVTNLAINARDAMPNGGRLIITTHNVVLDAHYVELNPDAMTGDYVLIEVSDTGTGMTPEVTRQVFEPFFTTKPEGKGTGLGLSMVYGFIKQSGGHIKIYSEVGHGTTIRLYLPRLAVTTEQTPAVVVKAATGGTETILVVEDNDDMRRMAIRQLKELGYRTLEASNGIAALNLIRDGAAFDLLFSDVVMPGGMNGFELGQEARKHNPDLRILFTSGFPGTIIPEAENGAKVELLSKPYRKDDLARRVRQVLDLGKEMR
ncbi:MAG: MASE4 domain-containing protein [Phaeospirillum sp.]|nr:MASE4 domain-containing protein [Phaeospirillum sp.]